MAGLLPQHDMTCPSLDRSQIGALWFQVLLTCGSSTDSCTWHGSTEKPQSFSGFQRGLTFPSNQYHHWRETIIRCHPCITNYTNYSTYRQKKNYTNYTLVFASELLISFFTQPFDHHRIARCALAFSSHCKTKWSKMATMQAVTSEQWHPLILYIWWESNGI